MEDITITNKVVNEMMFTWCTVQWCTVPWDCTVQCSVWWWCSEWDGSKFPCNSVSCRQWGSEHLASRPGPRSSDSQTEAVTEYNSTDQVCIWSTYLNLELILTVNKIFQPSASLEDIKYFIRIKSGGDSTLKYDCSRCLNSVDGHVT